MEYLKLFEHTIKHSDPIAVDHPLRDFSRKLENVVIALKNLDDLKNGTVKRFFNDNEKINIIYEYIYRRLLKISLEISDESVLLIFLAYDRDYEKSREKNTTIFMNLIKLNLDKYKIETTNKKEMSYFKFPLSEINIVLKKIEEYYIEIEANKYNL